MLTFVILCLCSMALISNTAIAKYLNPASYVSQNGQTGTGLKYMQGKEAEGQLVKDAIFQYFSPDGTTVYAKSGGYKDALHDFFAVFPSSVVDFTRQVGKMGYVGNRIISVYDLGAVSTIFIRPIKHLTKADWNSVLIIYKKMSSF